MRRLALPVVLLLAATGSCAPRPTFDPPPPRIVTAAPLSETPAPQAVTVDAAAPRRALIVGDSIMWDATPGFEAALRANGFTDVVGQAVLGMGLTKIHYYDWRDHWRRLVDEVQPSVVVIHTGAWDVAPPLVDGREIEPGTDEWRELFRPLADEAMAILTSGGASVYWIGVLPYAIPNSQPRTLAVNAELRAAAAAHPGVTFVDGVVPLVGEREWFAPTLPGADGTVELVRKKDGIHLCAPGVIRLAQSLVDAMGGHDRTWAEGEWRFDERYRRVIEGCVSE